MRIGLLGFGVVGKGLYDLAQPREDMQVVKVLCLEDITLPDAQVTHDFQDILKDETIDTVVEVMGGLHPAYDFVRAAMEAGKHIVTANKAMVAAFYDELIPLAQEKGLCFRCTAAVGGGIGWLSELERSRRAQEILEVRGIMNGTCNYILDNMTRKGLGYAEALKQAQALGYAEADPTADVEGFDTWNKCILSCNVAFGVSVEKSGVPVAGISRIGAEDVEAFTARGLVCKLIATGKKTPQGVAAYVQPTLVSKDTLEANVPMNYNIISLVGSATGTQSLYGQGAGRYPTAYNVLEDCVDVAAGRGFYGACGPKTPVCNDEALCFYIRGNADAWLEENTQEAWGNAVVTKPVSVAAVHGWLKDHPEAFIAAM